jgi:hypothetical protein
MFKIAIEVCCLVVVVVPHIHVPAVIVAVPVMTVGLPTRVVPLGVPIPVVVPVISPVVVPVVTPVIVVPATVRLCV